MLSAAAGCNYSARQASPASKLRMVEMRDNGPESRSIRAQANSSLSRSVYLPLLRGVTPRALQAFDPVTQTLVTGSGMSTTVPTQALFLLNSSFVRQQALSLGRTVAAHQNNSQLGPGSRQATG